MSPTSYQTAPPRVARHVLANIARRENPKPLPTLPSDPSLAALSIRGWPITSTIRAMRTAVVDIGTNSTRLLVADVDPASGTVVELHRESQVTRLGDRVDAGGKLSEEAIARVRAT